MHQALDLKLPHVIQAQLYLEDARRIIHVWTDLSNDKFAEIAALKVELQRLRNDDPRSYDEFWYYLKGSANAQRAEVDRPV